jgi:hypothetical protein
MITNQTLIEYGKQSHAQSSAKRMIADFISRSLMVQFLFVYGEINDIKCVLCITDARFLNKLQNSMKYIGRFHISSNSELITITQTWVLSLPKLLWELKTGSLEATKVILNMVKSKLDIRCVNWGLLLP